MSSHGVSVAAEAGSSTWVAKTGLFDLVEYLHLDKSGEDCLSMAIHRGDDYGILIDSDYFYRGLSDGSSCV